MSVSELEQQGQQTCVRHCRARYASRGQALIMVVLIMFLLAGLAGLFIAMINQAMVQTARAVDRAKLEEFAQAGLNHAESELLYGANGADWRPEAGPDQANRGWISYAEGYYKITMGYGPRAPISVDQNGNGYAFQDNPLDRLLKIDIEARYALPNNPHFIDLDDPALTTYQAGYSHPQKFLTRKITAFMPIGLTDYVRWITNLSGSTEPAVIGGGVSLPALSTVHHLVDTSGALYSASALNLASNSATIYSANCYSVYEGPFRSESPLQVGNALFYLTNNDMTYRDNPNFLLNRQDHFEVVGALSAYVNASGTAAVMVNYHNQLMNPTAITSWYNYLHGSSGISTPPLPVQYFQTLQENPLIRPLRAPRLDQRGPTGGDDRYRRLTADSAFSDYTNFLASPAGASSTAYSSYILGRGDGLYIDNDQDNQYNGDISALRSEWLNPADTTNTASCWDVETHRVYDPVGCGKAIELTLGDWMQDASGHVLPPVITLRWVTAHPFLDQNSNPIPTQSIQLPYPRNGVIFAEGNLVVKGNLPASLAYTRDVSGNLTPQWSTGAQPVQQPGGWDNGTGAMRYYVSDINRRFDLTIVSGATEYIEGNILGPASRHMSYAVAQLWLASHAYSVGAVIQPPVANGYSYTCTGAGVSGAAQPTWPTSGTISDGTATWTVNLITQGSTYDSKLGLLAMDNVCLNPTRLAMQAQSNPLTSLYSDPYWRARTGQPLQFTFTTAGPPSQNLRLLLRHAGEEALGEPDYSAINLLLNNQSYYWGGSATSLYFYSNVPNSPYAGNPWGGDLYPLQDFNTQSWPLSSPLSWPLGTSPVNGYGALNTLDFNWFAGSDYLLSAGRIPFGGGATLTGIDLEVDALMYAQRGSWFIIPGQYYNQDANLSMPWPLPQYQEPLDIRIVINGAIAENHPAPPDAEAQWLQHWRGSNLSYFIADGTTPALEDPGFNNSNGSAWDATAWRWQNPTDVEFDRRMGIIYYYDATLERPVCYEHDPDDPSIYYYSPRLPKLPVGPNLFSVTALRGV